MPCDVYADGLTICRAPTAARRRILACPICKKRTRFIETFGGLWYAPVLTCCRCGDSWSDGDLGYRPFARGWRKDAIRKAQEVWHSPLTLTPRQYRAKIRKEVDEYVQH